MVAVERDDLVEQYEDVFDEIIGLQEVVTRHGQLFTVMETSRGALADAFSGSAPVAGDEAWVTGVREVSSRRP